MSSYISIVSTINVRAVLRFNFTSSISLIWCLATSTPIPMLNTVWRMLGCYFESCLNNVASWRIAFISGCCVTLLQAGTDWDCCSAVVVLWYCCGAVALSPPWLQTSYSTLQLQHYRHHQHQPSHCTGWLLKCDGKTLTLHASTLLILSSDWCYLRTWRSYHLIVRHQASEDGLDIDFWQNDYIAPAPNQYDKTFGKYFEIQNVLISTRYFHGTLLLLLFQSFWGDL